MSNNHINRLNKGSLGAFISRCIALLLGFAVVVLATRVLGKEEFGVYSSAVSLLSILGSAIVLGIPVMMVRYLPAYLIAREYGLAQGLLVWSYQRLATTSILLGCLLGIGALFFNLGYFGTWGKISDRHLWVFLFIAAALPLHAVSLHRQSALQAMRRPVLALAGMQLIRPLVVLAGIWLLGQGVKEKTAAMAGAIFLGGSLLAYLSSSYWQVKAKPEVLQTVKAEFRPSSWWRTALPLGWLGLATVLMGAADPAMLGAMGAPSESGRFSVALRIATLIPFALSAVNVVAAPMISEFFSMKKLDELQQVLTWASRAILAYTIPTALFLWFAAPWYLGFFGQAGEYQDVRDPLRWLIAGQVFNSLAGSVGFLLAMTGNQGISARILTWAVVFKLTLNFILIPKYQATGAAMATASMMVFCNALLYFAVRKHLNLEPTIWSSIRPFVAKKE
jgi:O-antigen/teichoic acid export membrane protein